MGLLVHGTTIGDGSLRAAVRNRIVKRTPAPNVVKPRPSGLETGPIEKAGLATSRSAYQSCRAQPNDSLIGDSNSLIAGNAFPDPPEDSLLTRLGIWPSNLAEILDSRSSNLSPNGANSRISPYLPSSHGFGPERDGFALDWPLRPPLPELLF